MSKVHAWMMIMMMTMMDIMILILLMTVDDDDDDETCISRTRLIVFSFARVLAGELNSVFLEVLKYEVWKNMGYLILFGNATTSMYVSLRHHTFANIHVLQWFYVT